MWITHYSLFWRFWFRSPGITRLKKIWTNYICCFLQVNSVVVYRNPEKKTTRTNSRNSVLTLERFGIPQPLPPKKSQGNRIGGELIEVEIWYPNKHHEFQSLLSNKKTQNLQGFCPVLLRVWTNPPWDQAKIHTNQLWLWFGHGSFLLSSDD